MSRSALKRSRSIGPQMTTNGSSCAERSRSGGQSVYMSSLEPANYSAGCTHPVRWRPPEWTQRGRTGHGHADYWVSTITTVTAVSAAGSPLAWRGNSIGDNLPVSRAISARADRSRDSNSSPQLQGLEMVSGAMVQLLCSLDKVERKQ